MAIRSKLNELRTVLRAQGLRATPSRIAVLDLLRSKRRPVSHSEVSAELANAGWDPATLYRNLVDLADVGLVRRTDVGDHVWRFELIDAEHDATRHPHFVCTGCGTVECLPPMELALPKAKTPRSVRQRRVEVQVRGLCDTCG
ncbi:MAG: transcriptional repressor [Kofleriaceae bacterium]|nr:transcriptional repressor [Kofleriaceae bacterium]